MKIIDEIWYNGVTSNHLVKETNQHCRELCELLERNERDLLPMLSDEAKVVFEKFKDNLSELDQVSECEIFTQGVRLGARLMLDVLDDSDIDSLNE